MSHHGLAHSRSPSSAPSSPSSSSVVSCAVCADTSNGSSATCCSATCPSRDKRQKTDDDTCHQLLMPSSSPRQMFPALPVELIFHILERLYDNVLDVFHLYHTCRNLRKLIDDLNIWYKIYRHYFPSWSLGLRGDELLAYPHGYAWVVMTDRRCRLGRPATAARLNTLVLQPPPALSITPPTALFAPVLAESPTTQHPDDGDVFPEHPNPFLELIHPSSAAGAEPIDQDSSDDDEPLDSLVPDATANHPPTLHLQHHHERGRRPRATSWLCFGEPVTHANPGDIPKILCHIQTRHRSPTSHHPYLRNNRIPELEHRLEFRQLSTNACIAVVEAEDWLCSRQESLPDGFAPLYPVAQAVALEICANQIDENGCTRVLVAVAFGVHENSREEILEMMDAIWYERDGINADGANDNDGNIDDRNHSTRFILDCWVAVDVVELWLPIPSALHVAVDASPTSHQISSSSDETAYLSPVSSFGSTWNSSNHHSGTYSGTYSDINEAPPSGSSSSTMDDQCFTYPFPEATPPPPNSKRIFPAPAIMKILPHMDDGRRFRGRSARFITIDGEKYLFMLGLLTGQPGNASVQVYHLSRGLICSHQLGMFSESVAFFPAHNGYDHLAVLLNWGGKCEVWDIFEGRPVLSLYRDMPRSLSCSYRSLSPRFKDHETAGRSEHLPCHSETQWMKVSQEQYKQHGLRTWGLQVRPAVEGETPVPPTPLAKIIAKRSFRVVTFSDAWESDNQAAHPPDEFDSGRGMWETRWWHLDELDLGPPRMLTREDLMRPTYLPEWVIRLPLDPFPQPTWYGVERHWIQDPPGPSAPLLSTIGDPHHATSPIDDLTMESNTLLPSFLYNVPHPNRLPPVFAHSRHCEWLTAQVARRGHRLRYAMQMGQSTTASTHTGEAGDKKKRFLPQPTAICFPMDDTLASSSPRHLLELLHFEELEKIRVKIMLVWHHYRIVATSQRGIYMVDMEAERSRYGGQITVVQPEKVGDLVGISLAGHFLVITRLSGIETIPLAGPRPKP